MMRGTAFAHVAMAMVLLLTLVTSVTADPPQYHVKIVEEGPSLEAGEDSADLFLDTQPDGDHYLLRGYGHEGEYRVLDSDLSTVAVLEPPDGFLVGGCTFSDRGLRLLVWGKAPGDANDSLLLFDAGANAYDAGLLANVRVPLVTIDHARLYSVELILLLAGRDADGTSKIIFMETSGNSARNILDVPGNRTVLYSGINDKLVSVIDESGGMLIFDSNNWSLKETLAPTDHVPTVYEIHNRRFWTRALEDGTVIIGKDDEGYVHYEYQVHDGPLEGVLYGLTNNGAFFAITARSADKGGSTLEVWWVDQGEWVCFHELDLDGVVVFLHHVPDEDSLFLIGYENGSVVQHRIDIREIGPEPEDPFFKEGNYMVLLLLGVVVLLLTWRFLGNRGRGQGRDRP